MTKIIQIAPRILPAIDGVGDYAFILARELKKKYNIETSFIVGDPDWKGPSKIEGFDISKVNARTSKELSSLLCGISKQHLKEQGKINLVLQYVGYGYAKRGCPFWLVKGLEEWRKKYHPSKFATMFHELYAFGPPWRSSFWNSFAQKCLVKKISEMSDDGITGLESYGRTLDGWRSKPKNQIKVLPVFSNIGEPSNIPLLKDRTRSLIVFGQTRKKIYQELLAQLIRICEFLGIHQIYDIGPRIEVALPHTPIPVIELGVKSSEEISAIMLTAYAGFFNYQRAFLAKSGVFAAYAAHGLLPVTGEYIGDCDGLKKNKHYLIPDQNTKKMNPADFQLIADNVHEWYQNHNLSKHAAVYQTYFK